MVVDAAVIDTIKRAAIVSPRKRCRLCFHSSPDAVQQEMLIVMHRDSYVRPHRHFQKGECLMVVEGEAQTLIFDDTGKVIDKVHLSPSGSAGCFFYHMPEKIYHTLIFQTEWFVFIEATIGPFSASMSESAPWAPPETEQDDGRSYLRTLLP